MANGAKIVNGYTLLPRDLLHGDLYQYPNAFTLFQWLTSKACYKMQRFCFNGQFVCLNQGQVVTGRKKIAMSLNLTEGKVRSALKYLERTQRISIETTKRYSIVTIIDYDYFQKPANYSNQACNHEINQQQSKEEPTSIQQVSTNNKIIKKESKDEHIYILTEWNSFNIIRHKGTDKVRGLDTAINSALRRHDKNEIVRAIRNYAEVYRGDEYYFSHKWSLKDFLNRGLDKFIDEADPKTNFRTKDINTAKGFKGNIENLASLAAKYSNRQGVDG